jgi:hypothetical protein
VLESNILTDVQGADSKILSGINCCLTPVFTERNNMSDIFQTPQIVGGDKQVSSEKGADLVSSQPCHLTDDQAAGPDTFFWAPWLSSFKFMYELAGRKERQMLVVPFGIVGVVVALVTAAYWLPANPIGLILAVALAQLAGSMERVWVTIIQQK